MRVSLNSKRKLIMLQKSHRKEWTGKRRKKINSGKYQKWRVKAVKRGKKKRKETKRRKITEKTQLSRKSSKEKVKIIINNKVKTNKRWVKEKISVFRKNSFFPRSAALRSSQSQFSLAGFRTYRFLGYPLCSRGPFVHSTQTVVTVQTKMCPSFCRWEMHLSLWSLLDIGLWMGFKWTVKLNVSDHRFWLHLSLPVHRTCPESGLDSPCLCCCWCQEEAKWRNASPLPWSGEGEIVLCWPPCSCWRGGGPASSCLGKVTPCPERACLLL